MEGLFGLILVDTSYDDLWLSCSGNGSSLGQWADVQQALARIPRKRVCRTGTLPHPPSPSRLQAGWRPQLGAYAKPDKKEDTRTGALQDASRKRAADDDGPAGGCRGIAVGGHIVLLPETFLLHSEFFIHGVSIAQGQKDFTFQGNP
jgi:hypothetical protein